MFKSWKADSDKAVLSSSIEPIPGTEQCRYIEVDAISIKLGHECVSDTSKTHLAFITQIRVRREDSYSSNSFFCYDCRKASLQCFVVARARSIARHLAWRAGQVNAAVM